MNTDYWYQREAFMRNKKEDAEREFEQLYRQSMQQQPPVYASPGPQAVYAPPVQQSGNNALFVEVDTEDEARGYSIKDRNGEPIFLKNKTNGEIYHKWLNLGTGDWEFDIHPLYVEPKSKSKKSESNNNQMFEDMYKLIKSLQGEIDELRTCLTDNEDEIEEEMEEEPEPPKPVRKSTPRAKPKVTAKKG